MKQELKKQELENLLIYATAAAAQLIRRVSDRQNQKAREADGGSERERSSECLTGFFCVSSLFQFVSLYFFFSKYINLWRKKNSPIFYSFSSSLFLLSRSSCRLTNMMTQMHMLNLSFDSFCWALEKLYTYLIGKNLLFLRCVNRLVFRRKNRRNLEFPLLQFLALNIHAIHLKKSRCFFFIWSKLE